MAGDNKIKKNGIDSLVGWMENLEDASPEELRSIRSELDHNVEDSEEKFLSLLREKSQKLGIELQTSSTQTNESKSESQLKNSTSNQRLLIIAKEQGLSNAQQLADATELSVVLVKMLDRGLIDVLSIPSIIVRRIASVIKHPAESLIRCLHIRPRLIPGLQYKADESPELEEPQDFFEAVSTDPTLSDERREKLLALRPKRK